MKNNKVNQKCLEDDVTMMIYFDETMSERLNLFL